MICLQHLSDTNKVRGGETYYRWPSQKLVIAAGRLFDFLIDREGFETCHQCRHWHAYSTKVWDSEWVLSLKSSMIKQLICQTDSRIETSHDSIHSSVLHTCGEKQHSHIRTWCALPWLCPALRSIRCLRTRNARKRCLESFTVCAPFVRSQQPLIRFVCSAQV